MEVYEQHVRAGDHRLRRDVLNVEDPVGRRLATADGVGWIDAYRQPRQSLNHRNLCDVDEIAMRIAEVRLHATQAEHDSAIPFARHVLASVERFLERDPHATLVENGEFGLLPNHLEQLEV